MAGVPRSYVTLVLTRFERSDGKVDEEPGEYVMMIRFVDKLLGDLPERWVEVTKAYAQALSGAV